MQLPPTTGNANTDNSPEAGHVRAPMSGAFPDSRFAQAHLQPVSPGAGRPGRRFVLLWSALSIAAWAAALPLAGYMVSLVTAQLTAGFIKEMVFGTDLANLIALGALTCAIIGACIGVFTGLVQWPLLARYRIGGFSWALSTLIGWIVSLTVAGVVILLVAPGFLQAVAALTGGGFWDPGVLVQAVLYSAALGLWVGITVGGMQWLVLRERARRPGLWRVASPAAWGLTTLALVLVAGAFDWIPVIFSNSALWVDAIAGAIIAAVSGLATGLALERVL